MKKAFIFMGLPLSGKSKCMNDRLSKDWRDAKIVSADDIKLTHPDYEHNVPKHVHLWSTRKAEEKMIDFANKNTPKIVMDGGGINNSYTVRIINMLKGKGYEVELIHVRTPLQVCLKRNEIRERKVPHIDIIQKAAKERIQFERVSKLCDDITIINHFSNKHIFVDMDGVIAGLSLLPTYEGKVDFVNNEIYKILKPVQPVIDKLNKLKKDGRNIYILSAIPNSFSYIDKNTWLDEHFNIDKSKRFFVNSGKHKAEMLENLRLKFKLDKQDVCLIEDTHSTLEKVRDLDMNPIHVSEFLTDDFI
jgi:tRNA uridine 5-carbamoylmethylation protein Kti12